MYMRTALENSPTKEKLLDAAQRLVLAKGFAGTAVDDICKAARLTKGSFFHYFESKDELGVELLTRYCTATKQAFAAGCCRKEKDPLKRVYGLLDFLSGMAEKNPHGCLMGGMAQELSDTHPEIRSLCAKGFSEVSASVGHDLAAAKKLYASRADWDPKSLADYFVAVMQGSALLGKVRRDPKAATNGIRHFKQYLKQIFGR